MTAQHVASQGGSPDRARHTGWASFPAWAGIVGPLLFTATFLAQEQARRGEFDPVVNTVSALEAGPNGWIQQVNFVVLGVLTIVFALGLWQALRRARTPVVGVALLALSGVAPILAAAYPLREDASGAIYDPGGHAVAGTTFFLASALALIVLARAFSADSRWRPLSTYTLLAGLAALAAFVVLGTLVMPETAPLHDWAGLVQRLVVLVILFPCRVVISVRLLQLVRRGRLEPSRP